MGAYVNPGTTNFEKDINDDFYVDKIYADQGP